MRLAGQTIVGPVLSTTVIVCSHSLVLPQASVAVQVRVITVGQVPATESLNSITIGTAAA